MKTRTIRSPAAAVRAGLGFILLATVIAGLAGYTVQAVVLAHLAPADYLRFSVFWSALYLLVSGLAGIQQEVTRATRIRPERAVAASTTARKFGAMAALGVFVLIASTGSFWGPMVFSGASSWSLVLAVAVGAASYVVVAVFCGTMYGLHRWRTLAVMTSMDALLRLASVTVAVSVSPSNELLSWAVVAPFPITVVIVWLVVRRQTAGLSVLDVGVKRLSWNSLRTVTGSVATGILISGFPLFLSLASQNDPATSVGTMIAVVTLTRAPLVIPFLALQSYLLVFFRDQARSFWRSFALILGAIFVATTVAAALAWWIGPEILALFGPKYEIDAVTMGLVVASAGFTAALCVSGPAVLARGAHNIYSLGWSVAAAVVVLTLFLPLDLTARSILALALGPFIGLLIHTGYLVIVTRRVGAVEL